MLLLQNNYTSTNSYSQAIYYFINKLESRGYTCIPKEYTILNEQESDSMILAYAQNSFAESWDISDAEENAYWETFIAE